MKIRIDLKENGYDIETGQGLLGRAGELLDLDRKVCIVTDTGVPERYAKTIAKECAHAVIETVDAGEQSKSLETFAAIEKTMLTEGFGRKDCVVAVGGGVVGDLAGFAAACYMRGIDFYNIPTTVLSQVDSSIGGKTAVNFGGVKNIVGAFYQPKKVLIDFDVLETLPARQIRNGFVEAVKMAMTFDEELFAKAEAASGVADLPDIIHAAIEIKRRVVEEDEKEQGLRKVLNFGHTLGHGIEAVSKGALLHGECVGLGMLPMCEGNAGERLRDLLVRNDLPVSYDFDKTAAMEAVRHDKKGNGDRIDAVVVPRIGTYELRPMTVSELEQRMALIV
ncbi:MAG: 3-dehydroquinate synthase [Lachnospiraceae bacterium]|nr:3-dehydroquinate synthase [Lachnospiraceae bacterium]